MRNPERKQVEGPETLRKRSGDVGGLVQGLDDGDAALLGNLLQGRRQPAIGNEGLHLADTYGGRCGGTLCYRPPGSHGALAMMACAAWISRQSKSSNAPSSSIAAAPMTAKSTSNCWISLFEGAPTTDGSLVRDERASSSVVVPCRRIRWESAPLQQPRLRASQAGQQSDGNRSQRTTIDRWRRPWPGVSARDGRAAWCRCSRRGTVCAPAGSARPGRRRRRTGRERTAA